MKRLRIHEHFATLQDPRVNRRKLHALMDVVIIALLAVIAGAEGWEDMEDFGEVRRAWLGTFLRLRNGIPSADTFRRVFEALDPAEFQRGFVAWMNELCESLRGKLVAIDGKTARGSFARERGQGPLHLVSAWVHENALVLAQLAVEDKSNEIVAIPKLLELLDVRGATVTIDAMGCQKKIAAAIVGKGADYVLALKDNQPMLCEEVTSFFAHAQAEGWKDTPHSFDETTDKGHGRIEVRRVWASEAIEWLDPKHEWKGLRSVVMVERVRSVGEETSTEHAYYITSHASDAASLSAKIRGHWSIENTLHWTLDVTFHEDSSRIRSRNGVQNFAALRKLALALLKRDTSMPKLSVPRKRKRAAHLNEYALSVLCGESAQNPSDCRAHRGE
jgi:predicted transposase YbfD/YdcC